MKKIVVELETSNNLDYKYRIRSRITKLLILWKMYIGGLTHIPMLFLQEADPHQMKTSVCKNLDVGLV